MFDSLGSLFYDASEREIVGPLGVPEVIFIFILALLIFGPKKLPELGRTLGKALTEFRRASNELRGTVESEMRDLEKAASTTTKEVKEGTAISLDSGESSMPESSESHPIAPPAEAGEPRTAQTSKENPADGNSQPV